MVFHLHVQGPAIDPRKSKINAENNDFYCRLRRYQGLKQGKYSVKARKTVYTPFCLGVRFNEIEMPTTGPASGEKQSPPPAAGGDVLNVNEVISFVVNSKPCLDFSTYQYAFATYAAFCTKKLHKNKACSVIY